MTSTFGSRGARGPTGDPLVGRVLDGRYEITQRLARGGMATVYRGIDTRLTRTVAVKIMHVGLGDDVEFARKFDREARAAARLSHPNVVSVFDQGADAVDGTVVRPYIVMEYVEGETLRDVINAHAPLDPLAALDLLEPVVSALAAAHDAGLVHRDVKPENVLLGTRGRVKVADFGLAKAISSQTQTATQGLLIGTVSYLPPELVTTGLADARSDVYSAGVVLFELLTGRKPHSGETPIQVAYAHVHRDVPSPSAFAPPGTVPPYLDALVARATAREPALRPPDGRVLLTQVRRVRAALREGLRDDPELTQDLTPTAPLVEDTVGEDLASAPTEVVGDRADFEATRHIATGPQGGRPSFDPPTEELGGTPRHGSTAYGSSAHGSTAYGSTAHGSTAHGSTAYGGHPTFRDAPPPVVRGHDPRVRPARSEHSERIAARREHEARRRRRGWLALILVLLLTTVAAVTGWYLTEGRFTSAPALTTLTRADAASVAERADVAVDFTDGYSETVPAGEVVSTEPPAGARVRKGSHLEAVVSRGPERFAMPTVVGMSQDAATTALAAAHLKVGKVSSRWSDTAAKGVVLAAAQDPGASLKRDTAVALTVSGGPQPITLADWTGKDADKAAAALKKAGLQVSVTQENSDDVDAGDVISQDPPKGTLQKGDAVALVASKGPVLVTVPNVRAMGIRKAEEAMQAAGFKTRNKKATNYLGLGYVVTSSPGGGDQAPKGSTITLFLV
ncbi:Stk1 family PASTA domain-containing Ser/Thr kinase [Microlunatus flavus]|uniref:non-specific serine/threonine protein kinase n=1 Tax=Microlunatus flavus TaxID=1036181 RepID=A0A1H9HIW5_9ACTN|nr:Stk1 family PASTA domain-containing Ser/Thr kinase [Microlunatus flavus]SEQ62245.1 serine/threonine protein kinase [Microlunatus flavus]